MAKCMKGRYQTLRNTFSIGLRLKVLYLNRALLNNSNIAEKATLYKEIHYYYDYYYSYFHD